ncbi:MAG: hypothetical protein ACI8Z9_001593 [Paraglaciecola sp.]|jgi:hypothetical protein
MEDELASPMTVNVPAMHPGETSHKEMMGI